MVSGGNIAHFMIAYVPERKNKVNLFGLIQSEYNLILFYPALYLLSDVVNNSEYYSNYAIRPI